MVGADYYARIWWLGRLSEATSTKERAALVRRYCAPGAAARLLAEARDHRIRFGALSPRAEGVTVGSAEWRERGRWSARVGLRDVLYALRQARRAGKLHEPFKRSGVR